MKIFLFVIFILWAAIFYLQQSIPSQPLPSETVEAPKSEAKKVEATLPQPRKVETARAEVSKPVLTARRERPLRQSNIVNETQADPEVKAKRDREEEEIHSLQFPKGKN